MRLLDPLTSSFLRCHLHGDASRCAALLELLARLLRRASAQQLTLVFFGSGSSGTTVGGLVNPASAPQQEQELEEQQLEPTAAAHRFAKMLLCAGGGRNGSPLLLAPTLRVAKAVLQKLPALARMLRRNGFIERMIAPPVQPSPSISSDVTLSFRTRHRWSSQAYRRRAYRRR